MKTLAKLLILLILGSCTVSESLTVEQEQRKMLMYPDADTRRIIGYENGIIFKKRIYYKVVDGHGHKVPRIREHPDSTLRPIDGVFFSEYTLQN